MGTSRTFVVTTSCSKKPISASTSCAKPPENPLSGQKENFQKNGAKNENEKLKDEISEDLNVTPETTPDINDTSETQTGLPPRMKRKYTKRKKSNHV